MADARYSTKRATKSVRSRTASSRTAGFGKERERERTLSRRNEDTGFSQQQQQVDNSLLDKDYPKGSFSLKSYRVIVTAESVW